MLNAHSAMKGTSGRFSGRKLLAGVTPAASAGFTRTPAPPLDGQWRTQRLRRAQRLDGLAVGASRGLWWDGCGLLGDPKHVGADAHGDTVVARPARRWKTLLGVDPSSLIQEITA